MGRDTITIKSWPATERTRIDDVAAHLAQLCQWIRRLTVVAEKCPGCGCNSGPYTGSPPHGPRCPYR